MTIEEFSKFRHVSVHALRTLNDDCKRQFKITEWQRFDYDLDAGTLVFSENGVPKVIATIQVVGTTSNISNTWLWGWANSHFPRCATSAVEKVRDWGREQGISQLTEESSVDDEYLGWANTAIAARILGAKGAYRIPREDGGFMYLIYTDLAFSDGVMKTKSNDRRLIKCDSHGDAHKTYMCEHLMKNPKQEWFSEAADESNPWPDAWCSSCQKVFLAEGEWNEKNESYLNVQLVCHRCYEDLRSQEAK